jgi:tRNA modification GTPase
VLESGARQALPGEFTRRAVLNGKLDVLQAEATGDLIGATSRAAQRAALHQLDGSLSRCILDVRARLLETEALLAYDIDFPDEDAGPIPAARVLDALGSAEHALAALLRTTRAGELVREGALVVLSGVPNAGKSSLFNALLGQERAIVTDIPGTTRDAIEAVLDIGRWPLRLIDTAGMHDSKDRVERLGIAASRRYLAAAAVVLLCGATEVELRAVLELRPPDVPAILVATKSDLESISRESLQALALQSGIGDWCLVSAITGTGLAELTESIMRSLDAATDAPDVDAPLLTRARHRHIAMHASSELTAFRSAWRDDGLPATIAAVHLRSAISGLEELIGRVDVEDVLTEVFSRFCIGK